MAGANLLHLHDLYWVGLEKRLVNGCASSEMQVPCQLLATSLAWPTDLRGAQAIQ